MTNFRHFAAKSNAQSEQEEKAIGGCASLANADTLTIANSSFWH
jgi:hypothetical protein